MIPFPENTKIQFSGHETFPLRQLWLRKAYDAVSKGNGAVFGSEEAIATFGVGKNMVSSIRFWATACGVIAEESGQGSYAATDLGNLLFDIEAGLDPYCEQTGTTWLMHWILACKPEKTTTWYYTFNHVSQQGFDRESLIQGISVLAAEMGVRISAATLKRDVECFLRSYVPKVDADNPEEVSEPLLGELGLIQQSGKGSFEFRRGEKRSLPDGVFAYALLDYWQRLGSEASVMAFDKVAHAYGSPGQVFKLDEMAVADRLIALESITRGQIRWTEQAGMRQVTRTGTALQDLQSAKMNYLKASYVKN